MVEDSSVRVHVRQLRLKLHEYFDGEGRDETCIVEIPKGTYTTLFRTVEQRVPAPPLAEKPEVAVTRRWVQIVPWALAALFLVTTVAAWFLRSPAISGDRASWPLAALFASRDHQVQVVVADASYGMTRLLNEQPVNLDTYLRPTLSKRPGPVKCTSHGARDADDALSLRLPAHLVRRPGRGQHAAAG